jgi:glyoxylase-like metal-dependent hydrolase (beta-lactamase superfamily II)
VSRIISLQVCALFLLAAALAHGGQNETADVKVLHVRGPIYMIAAGGGNITASIGPDGVLLVDTGTAGMAEKVKAAIQDIQKQLSFYQKTIPVGGADTRSAAQALRSPPPPPAPVHYIFNTHADAEHVGGNAGLAQIPKLLSFESPESAGEDASRVFAHENVFLRMSGTEGDAGPAPYESLPTDTFFTEYYKLSSYFNGEGVQAIYQPSAHTDGDTMVWFRGSDVISTGDIYLTTAYPMPELERGGSIQGIIDGLNRILDLAIPESRAEGGTMIVPGHGRLSDFADVAYYRDMVTIIRDRVQDMVQKEMTLAQIKAARPALEYDGRYGKEPGSGDRFVEAVYGSLTQGSAKTSMKTR